MVGGQEDGGTVFATDPGEKLEQFSREFGVEAHRVPACRDEFLEAGNGGLKGTTAYDLGFGRPSARDWRADARERDSDASG